MVGETVILLNFSFKSGVIIDNTDVNSFQFIDHTHKINLRIKKCVCIRA